ncbi:hypothetical protein CAI16_11595 [Virgibacillus dokdonensis]|uniref:Uncharacterized protein n=1 Tax=Virgibacillus dokdonensis TaxID=302167 RepID=A0A3E0WNE5_9BACI|nr:hypothetical protein [Virgibacillus dokdonensis]RFA34328.1 hypothetical protein CAI16_11595 [Virgibacillus dokdonensis]
MMSVLLANQWKIFMNTMKSQPTKTYAVYVISFLVIGFFIAWITQGIIQISGSLTGAVFEGVLAYGMLAMIGFLILFGLPQVFKQLYAATDLNLLFTMPIPTTYIFWTKYLQSLAGTPLMLCIFVIVPLFTYGATVGVSLLFYPVTLLVLLAVMMIGLSVAYLINLLLIQIIPGSRANEFMTVMSMFSGLFVYLLIMLPDMLSERSLSELMLAGLPLFPDWVPLTWASRAVSEASIGSFSFVLPLALTLALAIISVLIASVFVEKGFRTGWIKLSEGGGKRKKKETFKTSAAEPHHPIIAVGKKEWYVMKRDLREWLVFMPLLFFFVGYLFAVIAGGGSLSEFRGSAEITWPIAQVLFLLLYAMLNGQIASSSIAREGKNLWILQILPLSGREIAIGKLWISWLIPFVVLTVVEIILGVLLGWTLLPFVGGIALKAVLSIGISGIGLWFGAIGAKYNPENPQNRLKFGTALILFVASYMYLFLALIPYVLLLLPIEAKAFIQEIASDNTGVVNVVANFVHTVLIWKEASPVLVIIAGIVVMVVVSGGVGAIFTSLSARRMERGIEIEMVQQSKSIPKL